jgi:glycosyltransferase involved in cell wall biosynthesis
VPRYEELSLRVPPAIELIEHCERENYGRILISTPGPVGLAALAAAKLLGVPVAGIYHTDFPRYVAALGGEGRLEDLSRSYIRWFYRQMDEVLVSSSAYAEELVRMGIERDRLRDLPRGVDLELFSPAKRRPDFFSRWGLAAGPEPGPVLLYAGRLSREKNLGVLLHAKEELRERGVQASLVLVGDGPERRALEMRWGAADVAFTGYLGGEELAAAYASADLFVFPSRTDTFGNAVLEAMASGLAPVVAQEGGPAEQVRHGETGLVIDLDRPGALPDGLQALLAHPDLRRRLAASARSHAESCGWDRLLGALFPGHPGLLPDRIRWAATEREVQQAEEAFAAAL